jgi:glycosyltransferase involved in cell wall biosynthesis
MVSYKYFLAWENTEVIIVDDSKESLENEDYIKNNVGWVTYIHLSKRTSTGEKRNIAMENSKGDYICMWDDDEYYGKERIAQQMVPILENGMDVTVYRNSYIYITFDEVR